MKTKLKLKADLGSCENIECDSRREEITKIFIEGRNGVKSSLSVKNGLYVDRNAFRKVFRKITGGYPKEKHAGGVEVIYLEGKANTGRDVVVATFAHGIHNEMLDEKTHMPVFVIKSAEELEKFYPTDSDLYMMVFHEDGEVIEDYFDGNAWADHPEKYQEAYMKMRDDQWARWEKQICERHASGEVD
jgi:hypothetical protein